MIDRGREICYEIGYVHFVFVTGYYHLKLTQHKQKLNDLSVKLRQLKEETMLKQKQIEEINIEYDILASKVKRQQKKLTQLLNFTENHTVKIYIIFYFSFR